MGQITKAFAELMTAAAEQGHHTPLTAWEQKQFAQAWLELQSVKAAGVQGDAARLDWLIDNGFCVREFNGRYWVEFIRDGESVTSEFHDAREAIDAAIAQGAV